MTLPFFPHLPDALPVQPQTGQTYWWILPYVNTKLFSRVLKNFADHFGVGQAKRIVLPLDQAGRHTSEKLQVPEGIHLVSLPSYSPELQLADRQRVPNVKPSGVIN